MVMKHYNSSEWAKFLQSSIEQIHLSKPLPYKIITPSILPERAGVYLITEIVRGNSEQALYVGRTKNLQQRLYTNHLMGGLGNARLKKYIVSDTQHSCFGDIKLAKKYIREHCWVRWILENDVRKRGALEGYFTAKYFPKYGISEEH